MTLDEWLGAATPEQINQALDIAHELIVRRGFDEDWQREAMQTIYTRFDEGLQQRGKH